jgi:hypothetical protein
MAQVAVSCFQGFILPNRDESRKSALTTIFPLLPIPNLPSQARSCGRRTKLILIVGPDSLIPNPNFFPVHHTPANQRKPPNLYDSTVYASSPSSIPLHPHPRPRQPTKRDVPGVPGAFMILDVFTPEECLEIVRAAEGVGFEKDEAAGGSALEKNSVSAHCPTCSGRFPNNALIHLSVSRFFLKWNVFCIWYDHQILARNFVWLADRPFLDHFYSQILPFVPPSAPTSTDGNGGGRVRGINARFRVYQYTENQVYRVSVSPSMTLFSRSRHQREKAQMGGSGIIVVNVWLTEVHV